MSMSSEESVPRLSSYECKQHILILLLADKLFDHFKCTYRVEWLKKIIDETMMSLPYPSKNKYQCTVRMVKDCIKEIMHTFITKRIVVDYLESENKHMEEKLIEVLRNRIQELFQPKKSKVKIVVGTLVLFVTYILMGLCILVLFGII